MTRRTIPTRHWRTYGNDPLPTGAEALDEPFAAFPSWFMRVTCERCGHVRMFNEVHSAQRAMLIRDNPRKDAPRRLRRAGREGGAVQRHRGRQQSAGAEDRATRGVEGAPEL